MSNRYEFDYPTDEELRATARKQAFDKGLCTGLALALGVVALVVWVIA